MTAAPPLSRVGHRPWPLPDRAWVWRQSWTDVLFAHWPIDAARLRPFVPRPLAVQDFEGTSWIGVVPFRMFGVMRRPLPDLPWISAFPELNVRIYVEHDGKPGVWFLSLDAANRLAVWTARRFFHLPYHHARITVEKRGSDVWYDACRSDENAMLRARYRPLSAPFESVPGTLEHWLTERYCLYARSPDGTLWRTDVHHAPWPLQQAEADIAVNSYLSCHGIEVHERPLLHVSNGVDVIVWSPTRVF